MTLSRLEQDPVLLPGGLVLEDGRVLRHATLTPMCGREEEWLAAHRTIPNVTKITWLLQSCTASLDDQPVTGELIRRMLVGDRDYLVLQIRRLTLGDRVHAVIVCPACENKMDMDFDIAEIPVQFRPQTSSIFTERLADRTVRFRLPNGSDQESTIGKSIEIASNELFQRCLVDDGGKTPSEEERQFIIDAMERAAPVVELELELVCPGCGEHFTQPFDTTSYFFEELNVNSKGLLREIHALALFYHWSETEILRLRRDRRRAYLGLINESMRPEM